MPTEAVAKDIVGPILPVTNDTEQKDVNKVEEHRGSPSATSGSLVPVLDFMEESGVSPSSKSEQAAAPSETIDRCLNSVKAASETAEENRSGSSSGCSLSLTTTDLSLSSQDVSPSVAEQSNALDQSFVEDYPTSSLKVAANSSLISRLPQVTLSDSSAAISDNPAFIIRGDAPSDDVEEADFLQSHTRSMTSSAVTDLSDDIESKRAPSSDNAVRQPTTVPAAHSLEPEDFAWTVRGDADSIHIERINHSAISEIHKVRAPNSKLIFTVAEQNIPQSIAEIAE
jgi:hypothetical protein